MCIQDPFQGELRALSPHEVDRCKVGSSSPLSLLSPFLGITCRNLNCMGIHRPELPMSIACSHSALLIPIYTTRGLVYFTLMRLAWDESGPCLIGDRLIAQDKPPDWRSDGWWPYPYVRCDKTWPLACGQWAADIRSCDKGPSGQNRGDGLLVGYGNWKLELAYIDQCIWRSWDSISAYYWLHCQLLKFWTCVSFFWIDIR